MDPEVKAFLGFLKESQERIEGLITRHIEDHCDPCANSSIFKERLRSQWFHIVSLWAGMLLLLSTLGGGLIWVYLEIHKVNIELVKHIAEGVAK